MFVGGLKEQINFDKIYKIITWVIQILLYIEVMATFEAELTRFSNISCTQAHT